MILTACFVHKYIYAYIHRYIHTYKYTFEKETKSGDWSSELVFKTNKDLGL